MRLAERTFTMRDYRILTFPCCSLGIRRYPEQFIILCLVSSIAICILFAHSEPRLLASADGAQGASRTRAARFTAPRPQPHALHESICHSRQRRNNKQPVLNVSDLAQLFAARSNACPVFDRGAPNFMTVVFRGKLFFLSWQARRRCRSEGIVLSKPVSLVFTTREWRLREIYNPDD